MTGYRFTFAEHDLEARASGALWWPAQATLCFSDLHLGRARRFARRGGNLIPPYETRETLDRMRAEVEVLPVARVIALGDSFDDDHGPAELDAGERQDLLRLMAGREWTWITGNHDPAPIDLPGTSRDRAVIGGLTFRHEALTGTRSEISGHYHPAVRLKGLRRPAFLIDRDRIVLPAFGAYTGGLDAHAPALMRLMNHDTLAVLTGQRALPVPLRGGRAQA